jgi:excisionase family DNA binding protein
MKRLTVSEAAEIMEISQDAVRKRVQRGTLPHTKGTDGRLYVYLDGDEDENSGDAVSGESKATRGHFFSLDRAWDFAQVSAMIAIVAAAIYVLGLLSLWVPIRTIYTSDFVEAWYAVALVPRVVVAGLGVRQLVAFPLVLLALTFGSIFLVSWLTSKSRLLRTVGEKYVNFWQLPQERTPQDALSVMMGLPIYASTVVYVAWQIMSSYGPVKVWDVIALVGCTCTALGVPYFLKDSIRELMHRRYRSASGQGFWALVAAGLFCLNAWYLSYARYDPGLGLLIDALVALSAPLIIAYAAGYQVEEIVAATSFRGWVPASTVALVAAFVVALMLTLVDKPPLPTTTIMRNSEIKGKLLTHTEGFWYLYPDEGEQKGNLIAIPDDKVKSVGVPSRDQ